MKTRPSLPPRLQSLTPADLTYIRALAAEHSAGLEQRCARYRRRANYRRVSVAACLFALFAFGADTAYAQPPLYTEKAIVGDTTASQASNTINTMLNLL
ncbi:MAG: hypothetical protein MJZ99_11530 [Bacteroidales bacterium]|nr:hypothetical protein [Bacteroidales bacterium]